uniref:Reverse transcriptase domain-containing protein n=1 Tax=Tanacetum cinerariifolium TaxID=118510 RepID=A0A699R0S4_TANCI|nr:reverse transcriptase domain-containing protein [Tanacetum cinerariifolium]
MLLATMRSSMRGMMMTLSDQTSGKRVVIGINRPLSRVVTGTTVIITTVMDQTGEVVVTTTAVATTTTLAVTTGIPVMGMTREIEVNSPTDLPILVPSSPGVPLRATPTQNLPLRFDDKIHAINALPLDMCEFDIILGMDWLTEHHATIDSRSYRVIFGDIHAREFIYHGSLPGKIYADHFCLASTYLTVSWL